MAHDPKHRKPGADPTHSGRPESDADKQAGTDESEPAWRPGENPGAEEPDERAPRTA